jgi:hypothetical protein
VSDNNNEPKTKMKNQNNLRRDKKLAAFAASMCHVPTLETQNSDSLDFHDVAVWGLRDALIAAYEAGREAADLVADAETMKNYDREVAKEKLQRFGLHL